ncbi:hypothetical protein AYJ11_07740 [Enterobacter hormaechei subsp. xiangfangensis]|nr:hypothetical protein AYJ11_07740 [Enterobacter hormaechei subsp. xiangfangensis]
MFPLTPALSLKGEGAVCAGIILWGTLSPKGERVRVRGKALPLFPAALQCPPLKWGISPYRCIRCMRI